MVWSRWMPWENAALNTETAAVLHLWYKSVSLTTSKTSIHSHQCCYIKLLVCQESSRKHKLDNCNTGTLISIYLNQIKIDQTSYTIIYEISCNFLRDSFKANTTEHKQDSGFHWTLMLMLCFGVDLDMILGCFTRFGNIFKWQNVIISGDWRCVQDLRKHEASVVFHLGLRSWATKSEELKVMQITFRLKGKTLMMSEVWWV